MIIRRAIIALAVALFWATPLARADFTFTQGAGQTMFTFTSTTGGTALCAAALTHCYPMVPIDKSGASLFVTGNAGLVTGTGGTFPATQSGVWNITNAGTFATQSAITAASGSIASGAIAAGAQVDLLTMRGTKAAGTAASNSLLGGLVYNATPPLLTDGQQAALQASPGGLLRQVPGATWNAQTTWTTATAQNTNLVLSCGDSAPATVFSYIGSGTITTGVITIQYSNNATDCTGSDSFSWQTLPTGNFISQFPMAPSNPVLTLAASENSFSILPNGARAIRARLTTAITGAGGQVVISPTVGAVNPAIAALLNPLAAGSAVIGKVGILGSDAASAMDFAGQNATAPANSLQVGCEFTTTPTTMTNGKSSPISCDSANAVRSIVTNQYPSGAVVYSASATGTTGATTATLAGAASVTTYLCGLSIRTNATAAATGNATVTGTITSTLNFTQWTAPLASGIGINEQVFMPCLPASGTNQSIAVVSAAPGSGGTISVTAWGYKL